MGSLRSKWLGPYRVIDTSSHGDITIQDDDGNTLKANGQRLKLFLYHHKALDEELDVIDLVDPVLMFKKSHTGQKGRGPIISRKHIVPSDDPRKLGPTGAQPRSTDL